MSFRIKTTHPVLNNLVGKQTVPDNVNVLTLFNSEQTESVFLDEHFTDSESKRQANNRPKTGSDVGMAIRSIPSAQADHM